MRESTLALIFAGLCVVAGVVWIATRPESPDDADRQRIREAQDEVRRSVHGPAAFPPLDTDRGEYTVTQTGKDSYEVSGYVDTQDENFNPRRMHWVVVIQYRKGVTRVAVVALQ